MPSKFRGLLLFVLLVLGFILLSAGNVKKSLDDTITPKIYTPSHNAAPMQRTQSSNGIPRTNTSKKYTFVMYGSTVRPERVLKDAMWYEAPKMKAPTRHTISVLLALQVRSFKDLCPDGHHAWVWVEDDVELCPGTLDHLQAIADWMSRLPPENKLVYVRTSFGFNGHVIRCSAHHEFVQGVAQVQGDRAIDDHMEDFFDGRVAVYRYNLFHHQEDHPSTTQTYSKEHVKYRDQMAARCLQHNFNTLILNRVYDSLCLEKKNSMSPCDGRYNAPFSQFPVVDLRLPEPNPSHLVVLGKNAQNCDMVCASKNMVCTPEGLKLLNVRLKDGHLPVIPNEKRLCNRITAYYGDGADQPMIHNGNCLFRQRFDPVCNGNGNNRICVCTASK